jgi:hypothetical protein
MNMMRTFLLFALLVVTVHVTAETVVTLARDGTPVANGEVCRFPARDAENPFHRWLSSQTVTCVAAGPITFPDGLWNVFGRIEGKAISNPVVIDGSKAPQKLTLALTPAATIVPTLAAGKTAVLYAPRRSVAFPLAAATQRITVPASEALWGIVLEKGQPAGIVSIPALDAETERTDDLQGSTGGPFVLGWLQVPEEDRVALSNAQGMSTPRVHLTTRGSSRESDPLPPLALLNGSFVLVRSVTAGEATLDVAGRGWIPSRSSVKIATQLVTTPNAPLIARTSGSLLVNWSSASDLLALDKSLGSCGDTTINPLVEITVARCSIVYGASSDEERPCNVIRQETFVPEPGRGSFQVDDVPPGEYRAELRFGRLPTIRQNVTLRALQQAYVSLLARYIEIYGSLTHGGKPVDEGAPLKFPAGVGFAARETGEYRAVLLRPFGIDARIDVATCSGRFSAFVLASRGCAPNARFDIDIPDNELRVNVIDTFTRDALQGAKVSVAIMSTAAPRRPVVTQDLIATGEGVVMTSVPEREIRIVVTHSGYRKQVVRPFTMERSGTKTIDVEMLPIQGSSAQIVSPIPFNSASVYWFSGAGIETEQAVVDSDGTFIFGDDHGPNETMAVVSGSHPLWVMRAPSLSRRTTTLLPFPDAPSRTFDISIPSARPQSSTFIGIFVGNLRVPFVALRTHQAMRRLPALVRGSGPLRIAQLLETGAIEVMRGPRQDESSPQLNVPDPIAFPQFATAAKTRLLPGAISITLP